MRKIKVAYNKPDKLNELYEICEVFLLTKNFLEITTFSRKCSPRQHLVMHFIAYTLSSWYNYINI